MKTWRIVALLGLLAAMAVTFVAIEIVRRSAPTVRTGELERGDLALHASCASANEAEAMRVLDGRRDGNLPYALSVRGGASVELAYARPVALLGVVVSFTGAVPPDVQLRIGARRWPVPPPDADNESALWLDAPVTTRELVLELPKRASPVGVAEITPLPADAPLWLIAPRTHADTDSELLAVYGAPHAVRLPPSAALAPAVLSARSLVVSNSPLDARLVAGLRDAVERGANLVELGPLPNICPEARAESGAPAASLRSGAGSCTRFLEDLSARIYRLRQGDPAALDQKQQAAPEPWKAADLFVGRLAREDFDLPRADRLGYELAAALVPRDGLTVLVSPLPAAAPALLLLTADQDFLPGGAELARSAALTGSGFTLTLTATDVGGTPDIVYPEAHAPMLLPTEVATLAARGHSVGIHPNLIGIPPAQYGAIIARHAQRFAEAYGKRARVVRNHHLIWRGYVEMAELLARAGLELDLDYVSTHKSGSMPPGFMTGSGLPMRFADERGRLLPIFQQATQLDDSSFLQPDPAGLHAVEHALRERAHALLETARREHTVLTLLHHSQWWFETRGALQKDLVARAHALGVPVWGAAEWLAFSRARRATAIRARGRGVEVTTTVGGVSLLVPERARVLIDGQPRSLGAIELSGRRFGVLPLPRGTFAIDP